jgi:ABC-type spermidine/putrescine transport system permease subunit I
MSALLQGRLRNAGRPGVSAADVQGRPRPWSPQGGRLLGLALASPAIILVALFVAAPLVQVFVDASAGGAGIDRYVDVFANEVSRRALLTTLTVSLLVAIVAVAIGSVLAWTLHMTERRWLRMLIWLTALLPFTMGMIVKNYAVFLLLVANGPVNKILMWTGVRDEPVSLLYTQFAVVYGIAYSLLPYTTITLYSVFSGVDRNLVASASILGATRGQVLRTVVFPLTRGAILVAGALTFVLSIGFYVTPILLGGLQTPFIATVISQQIFSLYDYPGAAATSAITMIIALVVFGAAMALAGARAVGRVLR